MITITKLGDLPFKDFAPEVRRTPVPARSARVIKPPVDFFGALPYRDFAPGLRPTQHYFDPDAPLDPDWRVRAVCRGRGMTPVTIARWFPGPGGSQAGRVFCSVCPVSRECIQYADDNEIEWGIWGGEIRHRHRKSLAA